MYLFRLAYCAIMVSKMFPKLLQSFWIERNIRLVAGESGAATGLVGPLCLH
jgi:hypothetical protein